MFHTSFNVHDCLSGKSILIKYWEVFLGLEAKYKWIKNLNIHTVNLLRNKYYHEIFIDRVLNKLKSFCESINKKSHTCEKGGAHLRISFWHLLMNSKNK